MEYDHHMRASREIIEDVSQIDCNRFDKGPNDFSYPKRIINQVMLILKESIKYDSVYLSTKILDFSDLYEMCAANASHEFQSLNTNLSLLHSKTTIEMVNLLAWIIIYEMLPPLQANGELLKFKKTFYDKLGEYYTGMRTLLLWNISSSSDFITDWAVPVSAAIISFLVYNFQEDLYYNWILSARIERDVKQLLTGFASPDINYFHQQVHSLLPEEVEKLVPPSVGSQHFSKKSDHWSSDLFNALTMEHRYSESWRSRRESLFDSQTQTALVKSTMNKRGFACPNTARRYPVPRGNPERSILTSVKAEIAKQHTSRVIASHQKERSQTIQRIYTKEHEAVQSLRSAAAHTYEMPKMLGFSYSRFGNELTVLRKREQKVDNFRGLSEKEICKKETDNGKKSCQHITSLHREMWLTNRHGSKEQQMMELMDEYFPKEAKPKLKRLFM